MPEIVLFPTRIERSLALEAMPPDAAYVLQHADLKFLAGRVRRGGGYQRNQITGSSDTITNCVAFVRRDCKRFLLDCSTAGTVRMTPGDGSQQCAGPLPLFNNEDCYGDDFNENFVQGADLENLPASSVVSRVATISCPSSTLTTADLSTYFASGYAGPGREDRIWRLGFYSAFNDISARGVINSAGTFIVTSNTPGSFIPGSGTIVRHEFNEATKQLIVDGLLSGITYTVDLQQGYLNSLGAEVWPS